MVRPTQQELEIPHQHPIPESSSSGLDAERHRRSQVTAKDAEVLRLTVVPGLVAAAVGLEKCISTPGLATFIDQIVASVGDGSDSCVRMLAE